MITSVTIGEQYLMKKTFFVAESITTKMCTIAELNSCTV